MPVIIRRPHAYDFLLEHFADCAKKPEDVRGGENGLVVGELSLPIPGIYILDAQGKVLGQTALLSPDAHGELLALLRAHATR